LQEDRKRAVGVGHFDISMQSDLQMAPQLIDFVGLAALKKACDCVQARPMGERVAIRP
jgi:hypothetical protein